MEMLNRRNIFFVINSCFFLSCLYLPCSFVPSVLADFKLSDMSAARNEHVKNIYHQQFPEKLNTGGAAEIYHGNPVETLDAKPLSPHEPDFNGILHYLRSFAYANIKVGETIDFYLTYLRSPYGCADGWENRYELKAYVLHEDALLNPSIDYSDLDQHQHGILTWEFSHLERRANISLNPNNSRSLPLGYGVILDLVKQKGLHIRVEKNFEINYGPGYRNDIVRFKAENERESIRLKLEHDLDGDNESGLRLHLPDVTEMNSLVSIPVESDLYSNVLMTFRYLVNREKPDHAGDENHFFMAKLNGKNQAENRLDFFDDSIFVYWSEKESLFIISQPLPDFREAYAADYYSKRIDFSDQSQKNIYLEAGYDKLIEAVINNGQLVIIEKIFSLDRKSGNFSLATIQAANNLAVDAARREFYQNNPELAMPGMFMRVPQ